MPPRSPDVSVLDRAIWSKAEQILRDKFRKQIPKTVRAFEAAVLSTLQSKPVQETAERAVESLPRWVKELSKSDGRIAK